MENFGERLYDSMLVGAVTSAEELAQKVGVSKTIVRKWLSSTRPAMSADNLIAVAVALNVRAHWLATGEGPATRFNSSEYTEEEMREAFLSLHPSERRLLRDIVGIILKHRED